MTSEILAESEVSLNAFKDALRACAKEAMARTARVEVPDFPEAAKIEDKNDEDFVEDYETFLRTGADLAEELMEFEAQLRTHIREHKIDQIFLALARTGMTPA